MTKSLSDLHDARINLECEINGRAISLCGNARYVQQPTGNQLRIDIKDVEGQFSFILDEATWDGTITAESDGYRVVIFTKKDGNGSA